MSSLIRADSIAIPLKDDSVDLIITSPPYFALRSYTDDGEHYDGQIGSEPTPQDFLEALWAVTEECKRVLKPSGSMWVNLGDKYSGAQAQSTKARAGDDSAAMWKRTDPKRTGIPNKSLMGLPWRYAIGCIDQLGLILRAEVIWSKPNGLPESVTDRVRRSHEQWFHFTKEPRYFAAVDEVREAYAPSSLATYAASGLPHLERAAAQPGDSRYRHDGDPEGWRGNPLGKLPGSVWTIPSEPLKVPEHIGVDHFAAFPQEWPRRIILGWSPSDGIVLDPFAGTGTIPMVARALGRFGIGIDLSNDYLRLAKWRVFESGHAAKTLRRTHQENQGSLL